MQVMLSNFNVLFKLVNRLTGKGTPIAEPVPATEESITVLQLSDDAQAPRYQNTPLTGWRNWTCIRNAIYAQHPTEEWYVKVNSSSVFTAEVAKQQSKNDMCLVLHVSPSQVLQLAPHKPEQQSITLSQQLKYARLTAKNENEPRTVVRFICEVNETDQLLTVVEVKEHSHRVFDIYWMALLANYKITVTNNGSVFEEIAQAKRPLLAQAPMVISSLEYDANNLAQPLRFGLNSSELDRQLLANIANEALYGLQQIGVDPSLEGPNVSLNGWGQLHINVTIQQFFQLCDRGWFFAQWLTPRPHVIVFNPFSATPRTVKFSQKEGDFFVEAICFQYHVRHELHCLDIFNDYQGHCIAKFTAPNLPELAQLVRAWMLRHLETISLEIFVSVCLNEDLQTLDTLITL